MLIEALAVLFDICAVIGAWVVFATVVMGAYMFWPRRPVPTQSLYAQAQERPKRRTRTPAPRVLREAEAILREVGR